MKVWIAWFLAGILIVSACKSGNSSTDPEGAQIPVPPGYRLVWNDEFDLSYIQPGKWEHEVNAKGGGNNELQYYTDRAENSHVKEGCLVIRADRETYTGNEGTREYTSARLRTKGKAEWKYGRFDIRAKMPAGQGIWPAIWMMPAGNVYGGWAASGEIDIMEYLGHEPNKVYGTLHYGGSWPQNVYSGDNFVLNAGGFNDAFHTFSLTWDSTSISWFVDDSLYQTQTRWYTAQGDFPAPFDQPFYMILNLAVGGNWPGNPDATTEFPQEMQVDYVRVFQKE
ncbi:glycoside hydrolase family 16 protein [bacterium]|nr:glycoside hydrolase family 16 protein [bacterium]